MKKLIVIVLVAAGVVAHADAGFARGGGAGGGASGGAGAPGGGETSSTGAEGTAAAGPGATGDSSVTETGPGDRLGGPAAGYANDPSIYRSPVTAWPGEIEYPSASPRSGVIVAPSGPGVVAPSTGGVVVVPPGTVIVPVERVPVPAAPLMCPGINATDPRPC